MAVQANGAPRIDDAAAWQTQIWAQVRKVDDLGERWQKSRRETDQLHADYQAANKRLLDMVRPPQPMPLLDGLEKQPVEEPEPIEWQKRSLTDPLVGIRFKVAEVLQRHQPPIATIGDALELAHTTGKPLAAALGEIPGLGASTAAQTADRIIFFVRDQGQDVGPGPGKRQPATAGKRH